MKISFLTDSLTFEGELNNSPASLEIIKHLPIESSVSLWGDEIYFDSGITAPSDGQTMDINAGDLGYWPQGQCFCIFFGPTPASTSDKPVPASDVVVIGKTDTSPETLRQIKYGEKIRITALE